MEVSRGDPELEEEREECEPRRGLAALHPRLPLPAADRVHSPPLPASIVLRYNRWQAFDRWLDCDAAAETPHLASPRCEEGERHGVERAGALTARGGRDRLAHAQ